MMHPRNIPAIVALLCLSPALFSRAPGPERPVETVREGPGLAEGTAVNGDGRIWKESFHEQLHLLGHRNWILVVDKAFPEQSSEGMTYLYTGEGLLPTLEYVLDAVESSTHVRPVIYRDRELAFLSDEQVPGIGAFKAESERILTGREVQSLLHDEVFGVLDESASLFRVLVLKTSGTLPYTSFFLQLDCSYWGAVEEAELRRRMKKSGRMEKSE